MKFDQNIIIVADLGQLKAYKVAEVTRTNSVAESLTMLTDIDYLNPHTSKQDQVSDRSGNFDGSSGEQHDKSIENEKRTLKAICDDIERIIQAESPKQWCLAFPKSTYKQLDELLNPKTKENLRKSLASDLTKIPKDKLLSHFQ